MTIVDFQKKKSDSDSHTKGNCKCLGCGHIENNHRMKSGVVVDECPKCGLEKLVRYGLCQPEANEYVWRCACGNDYFNLHFLKDGPVPLCVVCGAYHSWDEM